jgi:pimeloyl-ACP methyl ester carboxylesterase
VKLITTRSDYALMVKTSVSLANVKIVQNLFFDRSDAVVHFIKAKNQASSPTQNLMKPSTQLSTSLVAVLAIFSQSEIATSSIHKSPQHSIDLAPVSNNSSPTPQKIALQPPSLVAQQSGICKKWQIPVTIDTAKSPAQSGDIDEGVNRTTRCISINKVSSNFDAKKSKPKTWLIIHGWLNNSYSPDIKEFAEAVVKQNPGDRVLMLDWGQAAMNRGNTKVFGQAEASLGVYYAATWIRPIAEVVVDKLKNEYKLTDREANQSLNIIGHSLGTLMASEIGGVYKDRGGLPINSIIALDPASETSTNNPFIRSLGGYDVDGRTPAYIWNDFLYGFEKRDLRPEAVDRPRRFSQVSRFSRAFVGAKSLAGNQEFASWAHESFQMDFLNALDLGGEHGRVVQAFTNIISQRPFKQPNSTDSFLDLDDLRTHNDCEAKKAVNFMRCDAVDRYHEGTIKVDSSNISTSAIFTPSGSEEVIKVVLRPNKGYSYSIRNLGSISDRTYNIKSLGGNPDISIDTTRFNIKVELGEDRAKITVPAQNITINFSGVGKIIASNGKTWQVVTATEARSAPDVELSVEDKVRLRPIKTALVMANTAIKNGDVMRTKSHLSKINVLWPAVESMIKSKSNDNYRRIKAGIDIANNAMEPVPTSRQAVMEGLAIAIKAITFLIGEGYA